MIEEHEQSEEAKQPGTVSAGDVLPPRKVMLAGTVLFGFVLLWMMLWLAGGKNRLSAPPQAGAPGTRMPMTRAAPPTYSQRRGTQPPSAPAPPPASAGEAPAEAPAQDADGPLVWVDIKSMVYYPAGQRGYGEAREGEAMQGEGEYQYMTEAEARRRGYKAYRTNPLFEALESGSGRTGP